MKLETSCSKFQFSCFMLSRDKIYLGLVERSTARNAFYGEPRPFHHAVFLDRLLRIFRACWVIDTNFFVHSKNPRDRSLVEGKHFLIYHNSPSKNFFHYLYNPVFWNAPRSSSVISLIFVFVSLFRQEIRIALVGESPARSGPVAA